jgi:hypothetical protein
MGGEDNIRMDFERETGGCMHLASCGSDASNNEPSRYIQGEEFRDQLNN